jgi:hypothetical protein
MRVKHNLPARKNKTKQKKTIKKIKQKTQQTKNKIKK